VLLVRRALCTEGIRRNAKTIGRLCRSVSTLNWASATSICWIHPNLYWSENSRNWYLSDNQRFNIGLSAKMSNSEDFHEFSFSHRKIQWNGIIWEFIIIFLLMFVSLFKRGSDNFHKFDSSATHDSIHRLRNFAASKLNVWHSWCSVVQMIYNTSVFCHYANDWGVNLLSLDERIMACN